MDPLIPEVVSDRGRDRKPPPEPEGHEVDETIVQILRDNATLEQPDDGFVTAMRHVDGSGEIERFAIYAWGPSAQRLCDLLNIVPGTAPRRAPQRLAPAFPAGKWLGDKFD